MEDRCYTGPPSGEPFRARLDGAGGVPLPADPVARPDEAGLRSRISPRPGFGTNGCHYAAERGLPTAIYGPSRRELVHTVDEYIDIKALLDSCAGYVAMARRVLTEARRAPR